jgi:hypothetical protein
MKAGWTVEKDARAQQRQRATEKEGMELMLILGEMAIDGGGQAASNKQEAQVDGWQMRCGRVKIAVTQRGDPLLIRQGVRR